MGSRGRTTGPIGQTTGTSARCPTRLPAGIPPRIPTASTQHMPPTNALRHTACITPETRVQVPVQRHCPRCQKGNSGPHLFSSWKHAYASPRCVCPAPCVAWRCRAADYACCTSMTTTASAAACHVQIPHALTMQCAVNTWSTPPRIRMTGIAAAGVSRTPAISTMHCTHSHFASAQQHGMHASYRTPCRGTYRHLQCFSTASREKRNIHRASGVMFPASLSKPGSHASNSPGTNRPTSRSTSRPPRGRVTRLHAAGIHVTRVHSMPRHLCQCPVAQVQIFATDTVSPRSRPCHGAFVTSEKAARSGCRQ